MAATLAFFALAYSGAAFAAGKHFFAQMQRALIAFRNNGEHVDDLLRTEGETAGLLAADDA